MPELPEVETTRRGIAPHISGQIVRRITLRNTHLRWPVDPRLGTILEGQKLLEIDRRGKYLLLQFANGTAIWHLGMSGSLRILTANETAQKHDHIDWLFDNGKLLRFNDPRRFGALLWTSEPAEQHFLLNHLGPEPLSEELNAAYLYQKSRNRTQAVKSWIMDAKIIVGVGNIYANEALFASAIHPLKAAGKLTRPQCTRLCTNIKSILNHAIQRGGTTLRDFVGGDGKPGYFALELNAYGRGGLPCPKCERPLTEKRVSQRTTVFCRFCQK